MGTRPAMAIHFFFGTSMVVMVPSYYFCYRRREHHEKVIEMMMKYNQFGKDLWGYLCGNNLLLIEEFV